MCKVKYTFKPCNPLKVKILRTHNYFGGGLPSHLHQRYHSIESWRQISHVMMICQALHRSIKATLPRETHLQVVSF